MLTTGKPFWTFRVHEKREVLLARQKARQIAHLLHFPPLEEACVAAGVFAIAAQGRDLFEICDICFQLDQHQLLVFARPLTPTTEPSLESKSLMMLSKPVPEAARGYSVEELSFLIGRINDQTPADMFGEMAKQNQEILLLLHLLHHPHEQLARNSPSAA